VTLAVAAGIVVLCVVGAVAYFALRAAPVPAPVPIVPERPALTATDLVARDPPAPTATAQPAPSATSPSRADTIKKELDALKRPASTRLPSSEPAGR
jgi:hypothetical protein